MITSAILGTAARSALLGAVATKIIDTVLVSKVNNNFEQKRWLRTTKLELFSKLSEDILSLDEKNLETSIQPIKRTLAKIVLLLEDKQLIVKIEQYIYKLQTSVSNTDIDINDENIRLLQLLGKNIQKI